MATPNYDINYNDERLTTVEADQKTALTENEKLYKGMINDSDKYYQDQIKLTQDWADKQTQLQNDQTEFAIEQIEQQKDQTRKDYIKEQSGAYVDWQKQSNQYGVNAEAMAAQGMQNTGFSESSQVSMYNTYQNRVATARESYNRAVLNYDNAIKDARLQNNAALAEIAYNALQTQLELSLEGFQYKNTLLIEQANKKLEIENTFHNRYQDVLDQMNKENALAEEVRQHDENLAEEIRQYNTSLAEEQRQYNEKLALEKAQLEEEKRQFNTTQAAKSGGSGTVRKSSGGSKSSGKSSGGGSGKSGITAVNKGSGEHSGSVGNTNKSSNPEIDMGSVIALGYGPISSSRLAELEKQGLIESYTKNGKRYFRKSSYTNKQQSLFLGGKISTRAY